MKQIKHIMSLFLPFVFSVVLCCTRTEAAEQKYYSLPIDAFISAIKIGSVPKPSIVKSIIEKCRVGKDHMSSAKKVLEVFLLEQNAPNGKQLTSEEIDVRNMIARHYWLHVSKHFTKTRDGTESVFDRDYHTVMTEFIRSNRFAFYKSHDGRIGICLLNWNADQHFFDWSAGPNTTQRETLKGRKSGYQDSDRMEIVKTIGFSFFIDTTKEGGCGTMYLNEFVSTQKAK